MGLSTPRIAGWSGPRAVARGVVAVALVVLGMVASLTAPVAAPRLDVFDRPLLDALEADGFALPTAFGSAAGDLSALHADSAAYRGFVAQVAADVAELRAQMAATGRRLYEVTDDNVGRVFDSRWLSSLAARFQLAAVVFRPDRRDAVTTDPAGCGEVRFLYRLGYRFTARRSAKRYQSRLPFSLNVVHDVRATDAGGCAAAWAALTDATATAAILKVALSVPDRLRLKQLELNAQVVRFPSGQETTFGGQAAYLMRVFGIVAADGDVRLEPKPLENTPDVERLRIDPALKADLLTWLLANPTGIDRGDGQVPERFLATRAFSYSTYGSHRLANRPFSQLFDPTDFATFQFSQAGMTRSAAAVLERLDGMSCTGCHQTNATAGFHVIGHDAADTPALNRVALPVSPHYAAESPRRAAVLAAILAGRPPNPVRPIVAAPMASWLDEGLPRPEAAPVGMPCLTSDSALTLGAPWTCARGLTCQALATVTGARADLGQCVVASPRDLFSGHACLTGAIETGAKPWLDRFRVTGRFAAPAPTMSDTAYTCRPPSIGVPAGIAYRRCTPAERALTGLAKDRPLPAEICALVGGKAFDTCVASDNFADCLADSIVRGNRPGCGPDRFCREDYMCQEMPATLPGMDRAPPGTGFCTPTYFLFQMRLDGHPDPVKLF